MKKHCRILFATALFLIALVSCKEEALSLTSEIPAWQAQTRAAIEGLNANSMKVLSSTESSLVLELDVSNYAKNVVSIDGKEYFAISASEAHSMLKEGNPDLPEYAYSVVIPPTSACNVRVVDAEYEDISLMVAPSKGGLISSTESNPYTFSEVYEKDAFYPAKLASTDAPFLMRDVRGSVVRLHPFQYNPITSTLRVHKKMKVEVSFSGTDSRNVRTSGIRHTIDKSMEELFRKQFINYDVMAVASVNNILPNITEQNNGEKGAPPTPPDPPTPVPSEEMLIICCDSFATDMEGFMYYKDQYMQITTRLVKMSDVGTSAEDVTDCIQDDYDLNENLLYVLLVGDAERVPTKLCEDVANNSSYNGAADPCYALVSGTDSVPDIYVGRFCARNRGEVQTMVARTMGYESLSVQTWMHKSVGISDGGILANNAPLLYNYEYMDSIMDMLACSDYGTGGVERVYTFDYSGVTNLQSAMSDAINQGAFVVNYFGQGFCRNWDIGYFTFANVGNLQNVNKLPFVYSASPGVGSFTGTHYSDPPCFAEEWLRARNNAGAAIGAVGFYGSSIYPLRLELVSAALNFNSELTTYSSATRNFGVLCYNSAITMRNQYGSAANYILLKWNYFGDPSLRVIPNEYVAPPAE